jgi:hypothetical protein
MDNFRVYYSGACFESGDSPEQVEKKVHDRIASLGKVFRIEAAPLRPEEKEFSEGNYVVSFEGEIMAEAQTKEEAENQAYDRLAHLGQVTVVAFPE